MTKKIVWLFVSCLMVLSLLIASCGDQSSEGSVSENNEGQTITTGNNNEEPAPDNADDIETSVAAGTDQPQYGGNLIILNNTDIAAWNPGAVAARGSEQDGIMIEQILGVDRSKGPAGSGETSYVGGVTDFKYVTGNLAESWETPEVGVWILNIRQGVHFTNHPDQEASKLVGGREMTAEDVAASIEYMRDTSGTSSSLFEPNLMQNITVERTGDWQLTVRTPVAATTGYLWIMGGGGSQYVWPKEWLEQYGSSNNWYDVVGTGPYIVDDYVPGSAVKYIRNDNYWDVNPLDPGMGDQLPYPDSMTWQIIPDYSTRLAALRSGKADTSWIDVLKYEDFDTIVESNPDIEWAQTIIDPIQVSGRTDLEGPFSDIRIRKAMMLAIDHPTIAKELYGGKAEMIDSPARKWFDTVYTPLEELPEEVQELYGFNPEKAKQLMTEAGYPDGFKLKMNMTNAPNFEEAGSLIKNYWSTIGIDLELQPVEAGIFRSMWAGNKVEDLMLSQYPGGTGALFVRYSMGYYRGPNLYNMSHVNDPAGSNSVIEAAYDAQAENVMVNYAEADKVTKEAYQYVLSQVYLISMPAPWGYRVWQPWLKNYYGEAQTKFWLRYAWLDDGLKTSMGK